MDPGNETSARGGESPSRDDVLLSRLVAFFFFKPPTAGHRTRTPYPPHLTPFCAHAVQSRGRLIMLPDRVEQEMSKLTGKPPVAGAVLVQAGPAGALVVAALGGGQVPLHCGGNSHRGHFFSERV